jgi:hypothetical protein
VTLDSDDILAIAAAVELHALGMPLSVDLTGLDVGSGGQTVTLTPTSPVDDFPNAWYGSGSGGAQAWLYLEGSLWKLQVSSPGGSVLFSVLVPVQWRLPSGIFYLSTLSTDLWGSTNITGNGGSYAFTGFGSIKRACDLLLDMPADTADAVGGLDVTVTPLQATSVQNKVAVRDVELVQYGTETYTWVITDATGAAVDLSGKTVRLVLFTNDGTTVTGVAQYESPADLTVSGSGHNNVTRTFSTTDSGTKRVMQYVLWNQTNGIPLVRGKIDVSPALRAYS